MKLLIPTVFALFSAAAMIVSVSVNDALTSAIFGIATGVWFLNAADAYMARRQ